MRLLALLAGLALGVSPAVAQEVEPGTGAVLRGLDKVNGHVADLDIASGGSAEFGRLLVELVECRYPAGEPTSDAFAYMIIRDKDGGTVRFTGWMMASSPALNALEHPRYDIWVLRCSVPEAEAEEG